MHACVFVCSFSLFLLHVFLVVCQDVSQLESAALLGAQQFGSMSACVDNLYSKQTTLFCPCGQWAKARCHVSASYITLKFRRITTQQVYRIIHSVCYDGGVSFAFCSKLYIMFSCYVTSVQFILCYFTLSCASNYRLKNSSGLILNVVVFFDQ